MQSTITPEIVVAYSQCPRKAYLLLFSSDKGEPHEYVQILEQQRSEHQERYLTRLQQTHADVQPYSLENLRKGSEGLINARLQVDGLEAECGVLTRVEGNSTFGKYSYEPSIFVGTYSISTEQKLALSFVGYVLGRLQHTSPVAGTIIGVDGKAHTVKLGESAKALTPLLEPLQEWTTVDSPAPPPLVLNKHCPLCPFQRMCHTQAEQEDNLSLLDGITARVMRQYAKKGIFTVKQLSYLFKPRKRRKGSRKPPPVTHKVELQALAIREKKIYLQEFPTPSRQPVELFVDIEGVPDRGLYYLIGVLVCQGETTEHYAFWADRDQDECHMWQQFLDMVAQYPAVPLYHYGSYEPRAIATLAKRYRTDAEDVIKRLINVHRSLYGKVYFPVRSNRLKEIGQYLGAQWTSPNASGLQSLVWRQQWEKTQDGTYRAILVTYNKEDCSALKLLTETLSYIHQSAATLPTVDFADQQKRQTTESIERIHGQFRSMLTFAHCDADTKKIRFRQDPDKETAEQERERNRRSAYKLQHKLAEKKRQATHCVDLPLRKVCPQCGGQLLVPAKKSAERTIIDLVSTPRGMRKDITHYRRAREYCQGCRKYFAYDFGRGYQENQRYGHGLQAWAVYQRVALRLPYESIVQSLMEQFHEQINVCCIPKFMKHLACYYTDTEHAITQSLFGSPCIHVDETEICIHGAKWYIWVLTDEKQVVFRLTETREADVVHTLLGNYAGIMISDFYSGYDAVPCMQQKCWVHLIRV